MTLARCQFYKVGNDTGKMPVLPLNLGYDTGKMPVLPLNLGYDTGKMPVPLRCPSTKGLKQVK
ncbi:MAG: hypothetical protein F6K55_42535 [Moorea sp. SIO4A3]|nr:hypothetical protein [Moorena sp. SIO4A3]